jgi:hypothetical protein
MEVIRDSILITNHFLIAIEPMSEDHGVGCGCDDIQRHLLLGAIRRGQEMKSGVKIFDLTDDELDALISECKDQVYFVSPSHVDSDEFHAFLNSYHGMKRLLTKLQQAKADR